MTRRGLWILGGCLAAALPLSSGWAQTAASSDRSFVEQAGHAGAAEVQSATLAESHAHRADVRSLARTLLRDHDWINEKLAMVAQHDSMTVPTAPDQHQDMMMQHLRRMHGASFDRHWLDDQAMMHEQAIRLFRTEAEQGNDPSLKSFADKVLPRLEQHLRMVEKLGGRAPKTA